MNNRIPDDAPFFWNPDKGELLGRTATSWAKIIVFYIIYYACLAAFWAVMLLIFFQTLKEDKPRWIAASNIIGTNPGLGYRPMPPDDYVESTLVWFKLGGKASEWKSWSDRVQDFLQPYDDQAEKEGRTVKDCLNSEKERTKDKACNFKLEQLGSECTKENKFGYQLGKPCILIKLNQIYGWDPELYESAVEFHDDLKRTLPKTPYVRKDAATGAETTEDYTFEHLNSTGRKPEEFYKIWMTCEGENPADKENIGEIIYSPGPFFRSYYYPYENAPGYLQPLVAVQFTGPENGVLINIECKAFAKNIEHIRAERIGSVHFELLLD